MLSFTIAHLTPIQKTLLITLKARALDSRARNPILGDPVADKVMRLIDHDLDSIRVGRSIVIGTCIRSAMLDRLVGNFLAAQADAVVVEMGCGLATRAFRINSPPGVDWYAVDFEEVIDLRRHIMGELERSYLIGASLTDPSWLEAIPADRPVILVADSVLGFLSEEETAQILKGIASHFKKGGELVFNAYPRIVARMMGRMGVLRSVGLPKTFRGFGFDDPRKIEELDPRLHFVEERLGVDAPEVAKLSWPMRLLAALFARWRAQARRGAWVLRYRF